MEKDTQSNKFLLTLNNPFEKGYTHQRIFELLIANLKTLVYACLADEQGEQGGTYHMHILIVCSSRVRFSTIKNIIPEANIDKAKASISDCVNYIKKEGRWLTDKKRETSIPDTFEEIGTRPPDSKGQRQDMAELYEMVMNGMSNAEIISANQDYILQIEKIDKVRTTVLIERFKDTVRLDLEVVYISGETGTFKTRSVMERHGYANVYRVMDYKNPFDSYNCQEVMFFDEFRSSLKLSEMLLYCDIYPVELRARYSNRFACYNKVYIASNWTLEMQYQYEQRFDVESWNAFLRRISRVEVYKKDGCDIYASVEDYFNRNRESETDFRLLTEEEQLEIPFEV